ncbi:hypothetical protein ACFVWT_06535 [Arthrobacter sp. NPDC058288]
MTVPVSSHLPQPGVKAFPVATPAVDGSELAASPWLGLHFATECQAVEGN